LPLDLGKCFTHRLTDHIPVADQPHIARIGELDHVVRPTQKGHEAWGLLEEFCEPILLGLQRGACINRLGGFQGCIEQADHSPILVSDWADAIGEMSRFGATVTPQFERCVHEIGCLARERLLDQGREDAACFWPNLKEWLSKDLCLGTEKRSVGIVVDRDEVGTPSYDGRHLRPKGHAKGDAQRRRPSLGRPEN
jgi:hypothetical protein